MTSRYFCKVAKDLCPEEERIQTFVEEKLDDLIDYGFINHSSPLTFNNTNTAPHNNTDNTYNTGSKTFDNSFSREKELAAHQSENDQEEQDKEQTSDEQLINLIELTDKQLKQLENLTQHPTTIGRCRKNPHKIPEEVVARLSKYEIEGTKWVKTEPAQI